MSYLVVREAEDGSWLSDPNMFDSLTQAETYAEARPGEQGTWEIYECRLVHHDWGRSY